MTLGREVPIQRADGHVRVLGDIVHLNVVELARHRELFGRVEHALVLLMLAPGRWHGGWPHR
ncbi:Uncharacterised protein [Mycobacteroides abscessus subsp. abscessus]|nr:Uncharacterised protein [Mycobacteroides abscessus subsp. abscessus]